MMGRLGAHLELEGLAREFSRARLSGLDLFAAGELPVDALDRFEQGLRLGDRAGGVGGRMSAVRLRLSAHLALLTHADVVGPAVGLPQPAPRSSGSGLALMRMPPSFELSRGASRCVW